MSVSSSIMSSPLWGFLQVMYRFLQTVLSDLEYTLIVPLLQSVTGDFVSVFQAWQGNYGILAPTIVVASFGMTLVGLYLVFSFTVPVRDMVSE
ncbi:MAG: hypothetical protein KIS29_10885 [Thermoplasmata archaeon]|nr:hypothetical protein [Candidatus Sysuiplasma jiujiangense]